MQSRNADGRRGYFQSEGRAEGRTALILELGGLASLFLAAETVGGAIVLVRTRENIE